MSDTVPTVSPDKPETHRPGEFGTVISEVVTKEEFERRSSEAEAAVNRALCPKSGAEVVEKAAAAADPIETEGNLSLQKLSAAVTKVVRRAAVPLERRTEALRSIAAIIDKLYANVESSGGHGARKHHKNSPSTLQSKEVCPGYFQQSNVSNARAELGTAMHEACDTGDFSSMDDEQVEVIEACLARVKEVFDSYGPGARILKEDYLPIDDRLPDPTSAGYLDRGIISANGKRAAVLDFKFGLWPVEPAATNLQGLTYGLGILRQDPRVEEVYVEFLMPYIDGGTLSNHTFTRAELERAKLRVYTVIARAEAAQEAFEQSELADTPEEKAKILSRIQFNPTDKGCMFCDNKARCPALNQFALVVSSKYQPLQLPNIINPALISNPDDAAKGLQFFGIMKTLAESFRKRCTDKALNDEETWLPTGYDLSLSVRRTIADKVRFYETIKPLLTQEELLQTMEFTLGPLEEAVKKKAPRGKKKAAVEELKLLLRANGATKESEPVASLRACTESKEADAT